VRSWVPFPILESKNKTKHKKKPRKKEMRKSNNAQFEACSLSWGPCMRMLWLLSRLNEDFSFGRTLEHLQSASKGRCFLEPLWWECHVSIEGGDLVVPLGPQQNKSKHWTLVQMALRAQGWFFLSSGPHASSSFLSCAFQQDTPCSLHCWQGSSCSSSVP
jgi:hypothetical protein